MSDFFFPILHITSEDAASTFKVHPFEIVPRQWQVSTFDLATLASRHKLHISYHLMDVFLRSCNLELKVEADSLQEAVSLARRLRSMLYIHNVSPFTMPFVTTHSINEYAGINSRDSDLLREKLPPELRAGPSSDQAVIEAWSFEPVLWIIAAGDSKIHVSLFKQAVEDAANWGELSSKQKEFSFIEEVLSTAPQILIREQSVLHIWTGLESLFPKVSQEVSFRLALYIAQLCSVHEDRLDLFRRAKSAYDTRSRIAHGNRSKFTPGDWYIAWDLLRVVSRAMIMRNELPDEDALINELLQSPNSS